MMEIILTGFDDKGEVVNTWHQTTLNVQKSIESFCLINTGTVRVVVDVALPQ